MTANVSTLNSNHRLAVCALLLGLHLLVGVVLGYIAEEGAPNVILAVFAGVFFSQTSLVGFVVALVNLPSPPRLIAGIVGATYLSVLFGASLDAWLWSGILLLVVLPIVGTTISSIVIRYWVGRLTCATDTARDLRGEGHQFSIRHLLILTLVVGCLLGAGRMVEPGFGDLGLIANFAGLSACFVAIGVTSIWATLGASHLALRIAVVALLALAVSCIPTFLMRQGNYWDWMLMMLVKVACLLGSLLVLRLLGYRLLRLTTVNESRTKA